MNQSRRIILNIVATYGRTLVGLFVGLFCGRWTLMALGETDFGLYGLVGGLIFFFTILNALFASANSRFFGVAIGQARVADELAVGLEECRKWFNAAVVIHTVFPTLLLFIGYPLGVWAVRHWLTIPPDRIDACVWVFRFACITGYASMVSVPCYAMYVSKQCIAELTIYGFSQSILHFAFVWYMVNHDGDWLTRYAAWMCLLQFVPYVLYCVRAFKTFPECRLNPRYWRDGARFFKIGRYAFWQAFSSLGQMFSGQGLQILSNKFFGATINASMSVCNKVLAHATSLTSATGTAFQPVIAAAYGAGDLERVRTFAFRTTKLALVFGLMFVVPLCLEMDAVLVLWLKSPPPSATLLCICVLWAYLADKLGYGEALAVEATGRVAAYQFVYGLCQMAVLAVAWGCAACGFGVKSIGVGLLVGMTLGGCIRVVFASRLVGMPLQHWLRHLMFPLSVAVVAALGVGLAVRAVLSPCVLRIPVTAFAFELVFFPLVWFFLLDMYERDYIREKVHKILRILT